MAKIRKDIRPVKKVYASPFNIYLTKQNFVFLIAGLVVIALGFYLMSLGKWDNPVSLTIAPIFLVIGYLVLLPISIFYRKKKDTNSDKS